ncbi:MAG TPA: hypothetical protein DEP46_07805 [Blastocatellia bacterium]|mgnify:CR=1 FL=1|nr:hypothetical protein [Blastocatellia bacterium]
MTFLREVAKMTPYERANIGLTFLLATITLGGVLIGWRALATYNDANRVMMRAQLQSVDREILGNIYQSGHLHSIWLTKKDGEGVLDYAKRRLKIIYDPMDMTQATVFDNFTTVDLMEELLYQESSYKQPKMLNVRSAYSICESMLYLLSDVHFANTSSLVDDEELETYFAYLNDIGTHPLFLHALWYAHRGGYLRPEFAKELRHRYSNNDELREAVSVMYPDILSRKWLRRLGENH